MSTINTFAESKSFSDFLREAGAYPEPPGSIEVIETHISWVYLTDRYAYKLKKPVRFEFLDFSTSALRHRACLEELRLNRRLAPDVYIDVLPITQDEHGGLELNGPSNEVDWVVQMRRLSKDKALDAVLRRGLLTPDGSKSIAEHLATFYSRLPAERLAAREYSDMLDRHIRANGDALFDAMKEDQIRVRRIQSAQLRYLHIQGPLIDSRVDSGHIVDGHGDLRPEHIYLGDPPVVIDCIEFSDELRRVDIADELSFLAMECQRLGDDSLGELVLTTYERVFGDRVPSTLLAFYRSYRACVRAKVALLREQQQAENQRQSTARIAGTYIDWAERYAAELGPPVLVIIGGMIGSGKSTLPPKSPRPSGRSCFRPTVSAMRCWELARSRPVMAKVTTSQTYVAASMMTYSAKRAVIWTGDCRSSWTERFQLAHFESERMASVSSTAQYRFTSYAPAHVKRRWREFKNEPRAVKTSPKLGQNCTICRPESLSCLGLTTQRSQWIPLNPGRSSYLWFSGECSAFYQAKGTGDRNGLKEGARLVVRGAMCDFTQSNPRHGDWLESHER